MFLIIINNYNIYLSRLFLCSFCIFFNISKYWSIRSAICI